jgi:carbamate kinase
VNTETESPLSPLAATRSSLTRHRQTVDDQYEAAGQTAYHVATMIKNGWDVAISHGNGPRSASSCAARSWPHHEGMHEIPLDVCGADSQGAIGYALQQNLYNHFRDMGIDKPGGDDRHPD